MRVFTVALAVFVVASSTMAAPFSDVPRTHWAYDAIEKAVGSGVLVGYEGKFEGARLLNRYQMASVVARLLEAAKAAAPAAEAGMAGGGTALVGNLEALTIEFANELVLLGVKVSTLGDGFRELGDQVRREAAAASGARSSEGLGFTAFASFGLLHTDSESYPNGLVDDYTVAADSTYFEMPQVSLGIDRDVNPGVFFHAQVDYDSYVNGNVKSSGVAVNEAYFLVDEFVGDIGAKMGAFALPFSMEHDGPFRTCNLTITPSAANSMFEQARMYGLELGAFRDAKPEDLGFTFGIVSGSDYFYYHAETPYSTIPQGVAVAAESDDHFGFYVTVEQKPTATRSFGWNLSYFDNGGDDAPGTRETSLVNVGLRWSNDDVLVLAQYVDGTTEWGSSDDFTFYYLLVNVKVGARQSLTLRYDDVSVDTDGILWYEYGAVTFAFNRQVTRNSVLQFEYIAPDDSRIGTDLDDDLVQIRYKVHF